MRSVPSASAQQVQPSRVPTRAEVLAHLSGLDPEQKRLRLVQRMEQLRRAAPQSLRAHMQYVHRDDEDKPIIAHRHMAEWAAIAEDVEHYRWVVIVAPPGYAKSTWWTIGYPTWEIGRNRGRTRIGLIANTHTLARGFSHAIQDRVESPEFQSAYPGVLPDKDRAWRDVEWCVTGTPAGPNYTLTAAGMDGPIQSRRFDLIIVDDPTTYQQARSEETMGKQRRWVQNTLIKRLPPGKRPPNGQAGRVVVVLTRWSAKDLVPLFRSLGFKIITMPALGYWDAAVDPHTGKLLPGNEPLAPDMEDQATLLDRRDHDPVMFELVDQGNADVLSGDMFDSDWYVREVMPDWGAFDKTTMGIDTASGKDRKKGDYFAMARVGQIKGEAWIMEVKRDVINPMEQEDLVLEALGLEAVGRYDFKVVDPWLWDRRPDRIVIEDNNEGHSLVVSLQARHIPVTIDPVTPDKDKETRARPLARAYRQRMIRHPHDPVPGTEDEWEIPRWLRTYESELEAFPNGAHDDQVDAVVYAYLGLGGRGPSVRVA